MNGPDRELTAAERQLIEWMLEHGAPDAPDLLPQLEPARVTGWRCPCGCASIQFSVAGHPKPSAGLRPVADFHFGTGDTLSGIFLYTQDGVLSGLEVYAMAGDAPRVLPTPDMLRPYSEPPKTPN